MPSTSAPVLAAEGSANFTTGPDPQSSFPLLQTAVVYGAESAQADTAVNAAGGTATVSAGLLSIDVDAYNSAEVRSTGSGHDNLDWTRVGYWETGGGWWDYDDTVGRSAVFVTGYETPAQAMPVSGTATFTGMAQGKFLTPGVGAGTTHCACIVVGVSGDASFTANFGARTVAGTLTNMIVGGGSQGQGSAWNDVSFTSTIIANAFSGATSVTNAPQGAMAANATGSIEGRFFGPSAQEAGAVWTLFDGTSAAIGTLSGRRP